MNSLVTPMFYNQKGEKVNLENWMQGLKTQQSEFENKLTKENSDFQTEFETKVNNKINTLVTLNGAPNSSPAFWAPTTKGDDWQIPQIWNGQMSWVSPSNAKFHSEYYMYNVSESYANTVRFLLPINHVYVIFIYVRNHETKVLHLGVGIAGVITGYSNAPIVVEWTEVIKDKEETKRIQFTISVNGYNSEKKEVVIQGPTDQYNNDYKYYLENCAWLKIK